MNGTRIEQADIVQIIRLRLNGFKSFVDPTDLVVADGLTGIVGPNGCGKSNLLEALRWVMGETRPSAMRGGGMEDVIFAGAASRPARNFAEVVVTIDNAERLAPAAFNEHDIIEIARRITRDAGSAYRLHGKELRARDVQMMFADASTGAHSPALVRQGQISELINARPQSRRRVLGEAAGISGLYQRRHEAELKLRGAEGNLERVDDVIGQLAGQLAQLARQAKQAARYRVVGEALRRAEATALYRRWRDAEAERAEAAARLTEAVREAGRAEAAAQAAMRAREDAEAAMPPLREEEAIAAAVMQRLTTERDRLAERAEAAQGRVRALRGRLEQARKDRVREATLTGEADQTLADLAAERDALTRAGEGHDAQLEAAGAAADEAGEVLAARERELGAATEAMARLSARHQSVQRLLDDTRKIRDKAEAAAAGARTALQAAKDGAGAGAAAMVEAAAAKHAAEAVLAEAETALAEAEAARAAAQTGEADARGRASEAAGEARALAAEAAALERLVERDAGGGAPLLDRVEVAEGFEKAFGAALGDDLKAPVAGSDGLSGWHPLGALDAAPALPDGAAPLASHVRAPDLLDRRLAQTGLVAAADGPRLQTRLAAGQRLVSAEGDLWRWDGYVAAAADAPSTAALKLEQRNRLASLRRAREAAEAAASALCERHHGASELLRTASEAEKVARGARREAEAGFGQAGRALDRAEADRRLAEGRAESLALALARHEAEAADALRQLADAERQHAALEDLGESRARMDNLKTAVEAARITLLSRRSALDETRREGEARAGRLGQIETGLRTWAARRDTADGRLADLAAREARTEADLADAERAPGEIAAQKQRLAAEIDAAERRRTAAVGALAAGEAALRRAAEAERAAERAGADAREARARAETRRDAGATAEAEARARLVEEAGVSPEQVPERMDLADEALPALAEIEAEIARLRRQRDGLGAVNLRAEEDAAEVQQEHDTLAREKTDLEAAIAKLRGGIATLNREGRERLLTAFEEVNGHFTALFRHLFGGGEARLELVESDDPLEAGLEILCQPPGKKLATLSLLSGGEQTLTALALIFAVFLANPAPICVLDEVDAPLDDANVTRFCDMLDEMTRRTRTRFLIITHHAVTMSRMDRLFGVTMSEQGVSQLVSVDLKRAAQMVA